jgi:hypothetical protein
MLSRMQVLVFQSERNRAVTAFTGRRGGGNLPAEFAPWKLVSGGEIRTGANVGGVARGVDAIQNGIARDGCFLARGKVRVTRHSSSAGC